MIKAGKVWALGVTALLSSGFVATADAQSQLQAQPAVPNQRMVVYHPKKVWTEDDLASIRQPWDVERERKFSANVPVAESLPNPAQPNSITGSSGSLPKLADNSSMPKTVENTQEKIRAVEEEIQNIQSGVEKTKQAYFNASDIPKHTKLKNDLEMEEADLQDRQDDLKTLKVWLESLRSTNAQFSP